MMVFMDDKKLELGKEVKDEARVRI